MFAEVDLTYAIGGAQSGGGELPPPPPPPPNVPASRLKDFVTDFFLNYP